MANKERNKRSARQARQRERAEREALAAQSVASRGKGGKKASSQASNKTSIKTTSTNNDGFIARSRRYFQDVRSEMRRVTWPSRNELTNYSVAVVAMLIAFGICVWLVDTGVVAALVGFTGLRG